ncbi:two-component sensor histidine kinase [Mycolicibacter minnesotensis]|uniref:histidine kinase n=1 Tax=Mycolicibacter minnesotensis TaxID=1118379 RepID=A0A7I7R1P4_9MYCO|nr:HAMP domain-containing sensor histidine kinase [Mycolicibacter minnesotensis]ORA98314.1 two-component sensor histidine kinase [Mycolicibacter minnesotensis]BBY32583.1 two-component sensor histidine kinase [Mycolicibacter minnesotensis]
MTTTPSLRRRLTVLVLALLAVLMVAMGLVINTSLGALANRSVHERLAASQARADSLVALGISAEQLADHLNGGIFGALVVTADGETFGDPAIDPDATTGAKVSAPLLEPGDSQAVLVHPLANGDRVILTVDTTESDETLLRLRRLMIAAGLGTLVLAAILLAGGSRVLLAPLDRLTDLARDITTGDRGRRLRPDRPKTELGRAAEAFDDMLDELEASEKRAYLAAQGAQRAEAAVRRFLADAAHELRTPIAGMQAAAEQIAGNVSQHVGTAASDDAIEADVLRQHRRASLLLTEARRATRLVTDMLDLSYIDAGLPLELKDTDLIGIVDHQLDRAALLAPKLRLVRTGVDAVAVRVDPTRVAQILSNLLDNARRHTLPDGQITVDVRIDEGVGNDSVAVVVTDTGIGVRDEDAERIFDRLVRLDSARGRDHGGAGLGLPIARALAVAHGGTLTCVPHQGGACFRLVIPGVAAHPS